MSTKNSKRRTVLIELRTNGELGPEFPKGIDDPVLIEGTIDDFVDTEFVESSMLEIKGS